VFYLVEGTITQSCGRLVGVNHHSPGVVNDNAGTDGIEEIPGTSERTERLDGRDH
jgi:hypothetical protein